MHISIPVLSALILLPACGGGGSSSSGGGSEQMTSFRVSAVSPPDGAVLAAFPPTISVTFNRTPAPGSASVENIQVWQSGGDANFNSGNESQIFANFLLSSNQTVTLDFNGTNLTDDSYQVRVISNSALTDANGILLDGDNNGVAGENFTSSFQADSSSPSSPSFSSIETIFTNNCTFSGCHSGSSPQQGQNLTAGQAYTNIVGIASSEVPGLQRIEPGNPNDSYLIQKIEGRAAVGSRMPLNRAPLPAQQIQDIRDWVSAGALEN